MGDTIPQQFRRCKFAEIANQGNDGVEGVNMAKKKKTNRNKSLPNGNAFNKQEKALQRTYGKIKTVQDLTDAAEVALTWHEIVGRKFNKAERATFKIVIDLFDTPSMRWNCEFLDKSASDRLCAQIAALSDLIQTKDAKPEPDEVDTEEDFLADILAFPAPAIKESVFPETTETAIALR